MVNHHYLGEQLLDHLSRREGAPSLSYSDESDELLETGGGVRQALGLLGRGAFAVVNGDVWTEYPLARLPREPEGLAHVVLIDNPPHHSEGDFFLERGRLRHRPADAASGRLTFSGIGVYRPELFAAHAAGRFPLAPLLRAHFDQGLIGGEHYRGPWLDIGTPERLEALDRRLRR